MPALGVRPLRAGDLLGIVADTGQLKTAKDIEEIYRAHKRVEWRKSGRFRNVLVCTDTLKMTEVDTEVARASAKLGCPPVVIAIDYAQLVPGPGTRYERVSDTCEAARRLAKQHRAVVILVSQVSRPEKSKNGAAREVSLRPASLAI